MLTSVLSHLEINPVCEQMGHPVRTLVMVTYLYSSSHIFSKIKYCALHCASGVPTMVTFRWLGSTTPPPLLSLLGCSAEFASCSPSCCCCCDILTDAPENFMR